MSTLGDCKEGIPTPMGLFVHKYNQRTGTNLTGANPLSLQALVEHSWPGKIRELRYVVERAAMMCDGEEIGLAVLPGEFSAAAAPTAEGESRKTGEKKKK